MEQETQEVYLLIQEVRGTRNEHPVSVYESHKECTDRAAEMNRTAPHSMFYVRKITFNPTKEQS